MNVVIMSMESGASVNSEIGFTLEHSMMKVALHFADTLVLL